MPKAKSKINKSEWIRNQSASLSAKELVEKAKKEKISITAQQVYTVRHVAKQNDGKPAVAKPAAKAKAAAETKVVVKRGPRKKTATLAAAVSAPNGNGGKPVSAQIASVRQGFIAMATQLGAIEMERLLKDWQQGQRA